jgi:uncharacterized spore protein YtfJ
VKLEDVLSTARDTATVRRVFGEPYAQDGITVIPVARVVGGAGGGAGHDPNRGDGEGGGFGVQGRPVGAYIISNGSVRWRPAVDMNRLVTATAAVLLTALLTQARHAKHSCATRK